MARPTLANGTPFQGEAVNGGEQPRACVDAKAGGKPFVRRWSGEGHSPRHPCFEVELVPPLVNGDPRTLSDFEFIELIGFCGTGYDSRTPHTLNRLQRLGHGGGGCGFSRRPSEQLRVSSQTFQRPEFEMFAEAA